MKMIQVSEDALESIKRMAEQQKQELDETKTLLAKAKRLLDRLVGHQQHMITLEAYQLSVAIDAAMLKQK
jgi:hypothetical protein